MAEVKNSKPTASEKRKAADDELNARIAARQKAAAEKKAEKPKVEKKPEPAALPFVETTAADTVPVSAAKLPPSEAKPKKERKPRTPKAGATPSADLADMLDKVRQKAVAAAEKAHKAELKKLQDDHKAELKKLTENHKAILKGTVDKTIHDNEVKKAHEAGLKAGEKRAHAAIKAALKGGA